MDVASQIFFVWAEVGYVDELLLDQNLLIGRANVGFPRQFSARAFSQFRTTCRHSV
jgi:hypothetical protein